MVPGILGRRFCSCLVPAVGPPRLRLVSPQTNVFSNDGPLGLISSEAGALPSGFKGVWQDLNWLGIEVVSGSTEY